MSSSIEEESAALLQDENDRARTNSGYGSALTSNTNSFINAVASTMSFSAASDSSNPNSNEEEGQEEASNTVDEEISESNETDIRTDDFLSITRQRLRCLFIIFTCPIIPLATALIILLVYLVYVSLFKDEASHCSEPLRSYSFLSVLLFLYAPHHNRCKRLLSSFLIRAEGEGSASSRSRQSLHRIYDHLFFTFCLGYIYIGVAWTENCRIEFSSSLCSCPLLYNAARSYVVTLCALATVLALPLLCLPCVYFWIVRGAAADTLQPAPELQTSSNTPSTLSFDMEDVLDKMQLFTTIPPATPQSKECCICMMEFDFESSANATASREIYPLLKGSIVQTKCNHIFHRECMRGWMCGAHWDGNATTTSTYPHVSTSRRSCPLCRTDLVSDYDVV